MIHRVNQQILRLYISVDDIYRMNVSQSSEELVGVQLDQDHGNLLFEFAVGLKDPENGFRDVFHDHIQVYLISLHLVKPKFTYFVSISVERMLEVDYVGMV